MASYLDSSYVDDYEPQPARSPCAVRVIRRLSAPMGDEPDINSAEHPWSYRHMPGLKYRQGVAYC